MMTSRFAVPIAAVAATAFAFGITACGAPVPAPSTAKPPVSATPATPPPVPPDPATPPSAVETWCSGAGYDDYEAVSADIQQMHTDGTDGNTYALASDGQQLQTDAQTAGANLPPWSKMHAFNYGLLMGYLLIAGGKTSEGDIGGAATALQKADQFLPGVASLVAADCGG